MYQCGREILETQHCIDVLQREINMLCEIIVSKYAINNP